MPIYEFYCNDCNTIFSFFSRTVNTTKKPPCPRCQKTLQRRASLFACIGKAKEEKGALDDLPVDEHKLEQTMNSLAREAEHLNEDDPRAAASLMRKLTDMTGLKLGSGMQEALRRMEAGEDPEQIEADMGDILEQEEPFQLHEAKAGKKKREPLRDETLYEL